MTSLHYAQHGTAAPVGEGGSARGRLESTAPAAEEADSHSTVEWGRHRRSSQEVSRHGVGDHGVGVGSEQQQHGRGRQVV